MQPQHSLSTLLPLCIKWRAAVSYAGLYWMLQFSCHSNTQRLVCGYEPDLPSERELLLTITFFDSWVNLLTMMCQKIAEKTRHSLIEVTNQWSKTHRCSVCSDIKQNKSSHWRSWNQIMFVIFGCMRFAGTCLPFFFIFLLCSSEGDYHITSNLLNNYIT